MIDLPQITSLLSLIVGPQLRLETAYSFIRHKGCPQFEMHGGHRGGRVNFRYSVVRQQPTTSGLRCFFAPLPQRQRREGTVLALRVECACGLQVGDEIFTGLTVVAFSLQDISEADGGFACIPSAPHSPLHVTPCSSRPSAVCLAAA